MKQALQDFYHKNETQKKWHRNTTMLLQSEDNFVK